MINESFTGENPDPENSIENGTRKRVSVQIETAKKSSKFFHSQPTQIVYSSWSLSILKITFMSQRKHMIIY